MCSWLTDIVHFNASALHSFTGFKTEEYSPDSYVLGVWWLSSMEVTIATSSNWLDFFEKWYNYGLCKSDICACLLTLGGNYVQWWSP